MRLSILACAIGVATSFLASASQAAVVFANSQNNGFYTPFTSSSASTLRYGDDGYLSGSSGTATFTLTSITLGLTNYSSTVAGSTDISFHLTDGEAFGTNTLLYSTTITGVALPATGASTANNFSLTIPLPNVQTLGGFNNIGFDIGVSNYSSNGQLGFQCALGSAQTVGFYTNNAYTSTNGGTSYTFFSFGSGAAGVANFVQTISTPEPSSLAMLTVAAAGLSRRRRRI
jgi:PEP-CTERM motif